ncbi:MAG TPA: L-threonine 3-dehydrogenase [Nitrospirota bacterium]|nr:L-threonine 3-dehydrogenase [Nitrospirota bacterium]
MKAVVKDEPKPGLALKDLPRPVPGEGEVLIKVNAASVCGTDSLIHDWAPWASARMEPPRVIGHEFAGVVEEAGPGVRDIKPGVRVSAESHFFCGRCYQCRTGRPEVCRDVRIMGVDADGSFAEYVVVPAANVWINHPDIPDRLATLQEPLGNAVDTVLAEDVAGKRVLITGAGPMGLMCAAVARACGATRVIVSDPNEYRLNLAGLLGADVVLNPKVTPLSGPVFSATGGLGADVLLEVSGNAGALDEGLSLLAPGGRVSLLGIFKGPVSLKLNEDVIFKKIRVYGITGRKVFSTWYKVSRLLAARRINLAPLITHELPLSEFQKGFELMSSGRCGKVVFRM